MMALTVVHIPSAITITADGAAALLAFLGIWTGLIVLVLVSRFLRPAAKRRVAVAVFVVLALAVVALRAHADDFVILNPCKDLTPSDIEWWLAGCMWP